VAKKKPGPAHPRRGVPVPTPPENRAAASLALRTIFLNIFRHNSTRLNSARYEAGWRFTISMHWREGEPVLCPAAVGHMDKNRTSHHVDVEFSVSVTDLALLTRIRVDDAGLVIDFPSVWLGGNYARELHDVLGRQFGLTYPKVEGELKG
jgi:hypothetical protein